MPDPRASEETASERERRRLRETVSRKEERKLRARRDEGLGPWFWLGMMGLVGWSVAAPAAAGALLGAWIDRRWETPVSWSLTLLVVGFAIGCLTAWYWVTRESERE